MTMSNENRTASLRIPSSVLTAYSQFVVSLLVKDSQGRVVKGNNGEGDASYISAYVDAKFNLPVPQLVSPAEGTTVSEVSRLRFHYAQGIQPSWSAAAIQVCNAKQEVVAVSANVVSLIPEDEQDNWEYVVTDVEVNDEVSACLVWKLGEYFSLFATDHAACIEFCREPVEVARWCVRVGSA